MIELLDAYYCVYCGDILTNANKTKDHMPPLCFITTGERNFFQAITLPSCSKCNNGYSVQDENAKYHLNLCSIQMKKNTPEQLEYLEKTLNKNNRLYSNFKN